LRGGWRVQGSGRPPKIRRRAGASTLPRTLLPSGVTFLAWQVFGLVEHGRHWQRQLEFASDASLCLSERLGSSRLVGSPAAHFELGEFMPSAEPAPSIIITRTARPAGASAYSANAAEPAEAERQTFIPERFVRGLIPDGLLSQYGAFWQAPIA